MRVASVRAPSDLLQNEAQARKDHTYKALSQFLRPEFLGRIDEIVTSASLDEKDLREDRGIDAAEAG